MKTNVVIPYVKMEQIIQFMKIPSYQGTTLRDFCLRSGVGTSQTRNVISSATALGLIEYSRGLIKPTTLGSKFRSYVISGDTKGAKRLIKDRVEKVEPLSFILEMLNDREKITIEEIGRALASKYNKVWNNPVTYKTYGAACASIVAFAGYGVYDAGVLRTGELVSKPLKIPLPNVTFKKIVKIIENIYSRKEASVKELVPSLGTVKRLPTELMVCTELNLLTKESKGVYKITEMGEQLINPLEKEKRTAIFRRCLLQSRYSLVINKLIDIGFNSQKLGEIISYIFRKEAGTKARQVYGSKFLNWLRYADILKKTEGGNYILDSSKVEHKEEATTAKQIEKTEILREEKKRYLAYYELGKLVGQVVASAKRNKISKENIDQLISLCEQLEKGEDVVGLLKEHEELFEELDDPRIFLADIKFLEKKIGGKNDT